MSTTQKADVQQVARDAVAAALQGGARQAAASINRSRDVSVEWRDGKVERVTEATRRSLALQLYVDGRYSMVSSSDLRKEALATFIADGVAMTRVLAEDPFRALPDPSLYQGRPATDLQLDDPAYAGRRRAR
jgi:PmbA protein